MWTSPTVKVYYGWLLAFTVHLTWMEKGCAKSNYVQLDGLHYQQVLGVLGIVSHACQRLFIHLSCTNVDDIFTVARLDSNMCVITDHLSGLKVGDERSPINF